MNIVFVSSQPYPYGMAGSKRIRLFAEFLAKNNEVKVFVIGRNNDRNTNEGIENGVKYSFCKINKIQSFTNVIMVKKLLISAKLNGSKNVIFLYDGIGLTNYLYAVVGKRLGFKVIVDIVENYSLHQENTGFNLSVLHKINLLFEKYIHKFSDGVVVISTRLKEKMKKLGVTEERMALIPVSAENIIFNIDNKGINNSSDFTFIYAGSFGNKDGVGLLINAFKKLVRKRQGIKLLLAGKINDFFLQTILDEPDITYVGMVPDQDYYQFLNSADVLLMTRVNSGYANAGFPFKLGEYLATGKPVIATRVSDIEVYLKDKEDIFLAEPSNEASLLEILEYVIDSKSEISKVGLNGKLKCQLFFNPVINGDKLEKFIAKLFVNA
ncbi:MAG: glycosyltransferase [Bacteroidia bacterium]